MAATLHHRGPDSSGVWAEASFGIALGLQRLAILDLSSEGSQPMSSHCGRYVAVFNGEIYNFHSIRKDLAAAGIRFRGSSDTEVMLAAIVDWGLFEALKRFNGMFAIALWDRREHILHLVRDRLGEKPLYYGWMGRDFLFASELKALVAHPSFSATIDRQALALFMRYGNIAAPYSIYKNIRKLMPATVLSLNADTMVLTEKLYWSLPEAVNAGRASPFRGSPSETLTEFEALLEDAVAIRMLADVPIGAFLSGGVDSSTIVALMQKQSFRPVKTFAIGFQHPSYNEADNAAAVARQLGTEHTELYVTPELAFATIPRLPTLYDEPFADSSQIPTFLISQLARRSVTVSLSGDGGDELFGGYTRYLWLQALWNKSHSIPRRLRRAGAISLGALATPSMASVLERAATILPGRLRPRGPGDQLQKLAALLKLEAPHQMYVELLSQWSSPPSVVLNATEPPTVLAEGQEDMPALTITEQMMYLDSIGYLPDDILVKLDRASMGVSLEARVPYLDHRLVELGWRLPIDLKIRGHQSKWILRQVLYKYVPRQLIERPKTGFGLPLASWLRGPLRDWVEDLLDERRLREEGYLQPELIRQKWRQHLNNTHNWERPLWCALMFQAWLSEFNCQAP